MKLKKSTRNTFKLFSVSNKSSSSVLNSLQLGLLLWKSVEYAITVI